MKSTILIATMAVMGLTTDLSAAEVKPSFESFSKEKKEEEVSLPWLQGNRNIGDDTRIYIPDNFDYHLLRDRLSGSGFGPGNGGNGLIFEVDSIAKSLLTSVKENQELFPEIDPIQFETVLSTSGVFFVDTLPRLRDRFVTALNFPRDRVILIERSSWERMNSAQKEKLVFHEYLGIMGLEQENSFISNKLELITKVNSGLEIDVRKLSYLYSRSNLESTAYALEVFNENEGTLITNFGSVRVTFSKSESFLKMKAVGELSYRSISYGLYPGVDYTVPFETTSTLKSLNVKASDQGTYKVSSHWKICKTPQYPEYDLPNVENPQAICVLETKDESEFIGVEKLAGKRMRLFKGDKVVLPFRSEDKADLLFHSSLVELHSAGGSDHFNDEVEISSWDISNNTLSYTLNKTDYELKIVKKQNGLNRAYLTYGVGAEKKVALVPFVLVKGGKLPKMTEEDVRGEWLPIYAGSSHTGENQPPYIFGRNYTGGFESGVDLSNPVFIAWSWEIKDEMLYAYRYSTSDNHLLSEEETAQCARGELKCSLSQERDYTLLKKNGNRMTLLRRLRHYVVDRNTGEMVLGGESNSIWVMDKL